MRTELPPHDRALAKARVEEVVDGTTQRPWRPVATGTFNASVAINEQRRPIDGPQSASLDVAVRWARAAAAQVMVVVGGKLYSGGDEPPQWNEDAPPLPDSAALNLDRRRLPGWEHLDRTDADLVIPWDVVVRGTGEALLPTAADALIRAVAVAADVSVLEFRFRRPPFPHDGDPDPSDDREPHSAAAIVFRVDGRTTAEVCNRAVAACSSGLSTSAAGEGPIWVAEAYPTGSMWAERYSHAGRPGTRRTA